MDTMQSFDLIILMCAMSMPLRQTQKKFGRDLAQPRGLVKDFGAGAFTGRLNDGNGKNAPDGPCPSRW